MKKRNHSSSAASSSGAGLLSAGLTTLFALFLCATVFFGALPLALLMFYVGASIVAFALYGFDKAAAQNRRSRIPENALHMLGLIGGWPGALAAQKLLRHKSRKQSFQVIFWLTVAANLGMLGWLLSATGFSSAGLILAP